VFAGTAAGVHADAAISALGGFDTDLHDERHGKKSMKANGKDRFLIPGMRFRCMMQRCSSIFPLLFWNFSFLRVSTLLYFNRGCSCYLQHAVCLSKLVRFGARINSACNIFLNETLELPLTANK